MGTFAVAFNVHKISQRITIHIEKFVQNDLPIHTPSLSYLFYSFNEKTYLFDPHLLFNCLTVEIFV